MPLLEGNPLGIRNVVPRSIRNYFAIATKQDNILFGEPQLDAKLAEIYTRVREASRLLLDTDIVIDNVLIHADAYLYALRTIFRSAARQVRIFTHQLEQRMLDGTPLFTDPEIIDAVVRLLSNKDASVEIVFRKRPSENLFETDSLMREIKRFDNLKVFYAENKVVKACNCTFIGVDDRIYNLRYRNYALINFNDPAYTRMLAEIFVRIRSLLTTSAYDFHQAA